MSNKQPGMTASIGITQWFFPGLDEKSLWKAKDLGFDAVQLELGPWEQGLPLSREEVQQRYREESRAVGLKLLPLTINTVCDHPFVGGPDTRDGLLAAHAIEKGIEAAASMGLEGITIPNFGKNCISTPAHYENTVLALCTACRLAKPLGLTVYTENVLNTAQLEQLFLDCGCENLRLLFDSQNYTHFGLSCAMDVLQSFFTRSGTHVHVKSGTGEQSAPLGDGEGPVLEVLRFLREKQYTGTIVLENNYAAPPLKDENFRSMRRDLALVRQEMDR